TVAAFAVLVLAGTLIRTTRVHADDNSRGSNAATIQENFKIAPAPLNPRGKPPKLVPDAVKSSKFKVRVDLVGQMQSPGNLTSPVIAGSQLLLIDQGGYLDRW